MSVTKTIRLDPAALEAAAQSIADVDSALPTTDYTIAWPEMTADAKEPYLSAAEAAVTAYLAAIEPQVRAIRERVKKMGMHYPHNDESGQPSEWLEGLHYGLKRVLPEFDANFSLLGMETTDGRV